MIEPADAKTTPGVVSVVIVNYRGADDTIQCVEGLRGLDWPTELLQIVVVDNASGDDSAARIRAAAPDITLIESQENTGFAGGCNLGIAHSVGQFVALINSDARPHPGWLSAAVAALRADASVAAVASKVLDWEGARIDYVGGSVNFVGQGYKAEVGQLDDGSFETAQDVLFFTGAAAVIRKDLFHTVGGFDEQYFMFFEDVDLGWRMNLAGYRVRYVPGSIVYHKHHASIAKFGSYREQYLLARNSLLTIYKNFGDEVLQKVFAPALLLSVHNASLIGEADTSALDLQRTGSGDDVPTLTVRKEALSGAFALDYVTTHLAELTEQRAEVQATRKLTDSALAPLFGDLTRATSMVPGFDVAWRDAVTAFSLDHALIRPTRIVVITGDTLSPRMAGPAIRAFHIAHELSGEHEVKLVSTTTCSISNPGFVCTFADDEALREIVEWSDVVIFQGFVMFHAPWIAETDKVVVVDIYDPMHLEQLEQLKDDGLAHRESINTGTTGVLNDQLRRGDFFLCASEEQRHFWLGQLAGLGRLNPETYDRDSSLRSLLDIAPFGLVRRAPMRSRSAIKGVVPGISATDRVVLWGGGVYNWFDPITLINAIDELRHEHADVRLFFLGMKHPNPNVPKMQMAWRARQLSDRLGLTDKFVFFNEEWVDYEDRENYLLDADVGVSTHFQHVETTFSFRTRILDYIWAGMPIVATEGDAFGRIIAAEGIGVSVAERDVSGLADALRRALYDEEFIATCRANINRVRDEFFWDSALAPLLEFCRRPIRSGDAKLMEQVREKRRRGRYLRLNPDGKLGRNIRYVQIHYERDGAAGVLRNGAAKIRRIAMRSR